MGRADEGLHDVEELLRRGGVADEVTHRNAHRATLAEPDFLALGWPHPFDAARLWVGLLVAEAALLELQSGERSTSVREPLRRFLGC